MTFSAYFPGFRCLWSSKVVPEQQKAARVAYWAEDRTGGRRCGGRRPRGGTTGIVPQDSLEVIYLDFAHQGTLNP